MRVAFFLHGFPPAEVGGVELYGRALVGELGRLGVDCIVLAGSMTPSTRPGLLASFEGEIPVTRLLSPSHRPGHRAMEWDPEGEALIREFLLQTRPDLVHIQHWFRLSVRLVALSAEVGIPAVVTLSDQWAVCPRIHRLRANLVPCTARYTERLCIDCVDRDPWQSDDEIASALGFRFQSIQQELALAARLVVPSESAADLFSQLSGLPRSRLQVLPMGWLHDTPLAPAQASAALGPLRVGHWGHLTPYKGPHLLLLAARQLSNGPPVEIHFWGEPFSEPYGKYLLALAEGLRVTFHGRYSPPDLQRADLDVAAFPSLCSETHSFVLDEALALGLPVIVPDRGALAERVGAKGIMFQSGSAIDLSRTLREVAGSIETRHALQAARAPSIPSLAEHARALLELYRSVQDSKEVTSMSNAPDSGRPAFLRTQVDERDRHLDTLLQRDAELREENKRLREELASVRASLQAEVGRLEESRHRLTVAEAMLQEILASKAWRFITVLRHIKAALPPWR